MVTNNDNFVLCPKVKGNEPSKQPVVSITIVKEYTLLSVLSAYIRAEILGGIGTSYLTFKAECTSLPSTPP